jgi:hypothetical protein
MSYFWTFESNLPSGMGVETFSFAHIIVLVLEGILFDDKSAQVNILKNRNADWTAFLFFYVRQHKD